MFASNCALGRRLPQTLPNTPDQGGIIPSPCPPTILQCPPEAPSMLRRMEVSHAVWLHKLCHKLEFDHPCSVGFARSPEDEEGHHEQGLAVGHLIHSPCDLMKVFPLSGDLISGPQS